MKKVFLLTLIVGSLSITSFAQGVDKSFYRSPYKNRNIGSFDRGTALLSFGLGFPNVVTDYGYGYGNRTGTPTLYAKFEHGAISDEIGIGGLLAFSNSVAKYGSDKLHVTAVAVAILGYYHFNKLIPVKNLDVYAGTGLLIRSVTYNYDNNSTLYPDNNSTDPYIIFNVGARYYVKPNFGFYAEATSDHMSSVNLGITFRF